MGLGHVAPLIEADTRRIFHVYKEFQIGRPIIRNTSHNDNARIIAAIPNDKIKKVNWIELEELGAV